MESQVSSSRTGMRGCGDGPAGWCRRRRRTRAGISPEQVSLWASAPSARSRSMITHRARHWVLIFLVFCLWPPPEIPLCCQSWNVPLLPPVPGLINRPAADGSLIHHSWQLCDDKIQGGGVITVLWRDTEHSRGINTATQWKIHTSLSDHLHSGQGCVTIPLSLCVCILCKPWVYCCSFSFIVAVIYADYVLLTIHHANGLHDYPPRTEDNTDCEAVMERVSTVKQYSAARRCICHLAASMCPHQLFLCWFYFFVSLQTP